VLDAMGFDPILIETVGVGQDEVEVVRIAHTSVVVTVPGLGDDIQAIKAGLLEIADVFVVNKADRDGVDRTVMDIRALQGLAAVPEGRWVPPVVRTIATRNDGVAALVSAIADHQRSLPPPEANERERRRVSHILESLVRDGLLAAMDQALAAGDGKDALLDRIAGKKTIHRNRAARKKSRMARRLATIKQG